MELTSQQTLPVPQQQAWEALNDIGLLLQTGERPPEKRIPILQKIGTPKGDYFWRYPLP